MGFALGSVLVVLYAAVIAAFVDAALDGRALPVHGDGGQTRDFTYVGSLTAIVVETVARRAPSPTLANLAFGSRRSLLEVVAEPEAVLGRRLEVEHRGCPGRATCWTPKPTRAGCESCSPR